jgi:hypothetical protein
VHETILLSSKDSLLVAIPFIGLLLVGYFRLDQIIASPKKKGRRRPMSGMDESGEPIMSDPDGRPSGAPRTRRQQGFTRSVSRN